MIIIKPIDGIDGIRSIRQMASMMFNMELGKKIFDSDGKLLQKHEPMHTIKKNGVTYSIQGLVGYILILRKDGGILVGGEWDDFIESLNTELSKLDDMYIKTYGSIRIYHESSMDYTLVSRLYTDEVYDRKRMRRVIRKSDHKRITDNDTNCVAISNCSKTGIFNWFLLDNEAFLLDNWFLSNKKRIRLIFGRLTLTARFQVETGGNTHICYDTTR